MLPVVHREERLAVARAATVVDVVHDVAMVDERLRQREVADLRLATGSAVDQDKCRSLVVGRRLVRTVQ